MLNRREGQFVWVHFDEGFVAEFIHANEFAMFRMEKKLWSCEVEGLMVEDAERAQIYWKNQSEYCRRVPSCLWIIHCVFSDRIVIYLTLTDPNGGIWNWAKGQCVRNATSFYCERSHSQTARTVQILSSGGVEMNEPESLNELEWFKL